MGGAESKSLQGGFRVTWVHNGGPASAAGLEAFFDYVVKASHLETTEFSQQLQDAFFRVLQDHENRTLRLIVYNARAKALRTVDLLPKRWVGSGIVGASVHFDELDAAMSQSVHVLHVYPDSPAFYAGFHPSTDYLLCSRTHIFKTVPDLAAAIDDAVGATIPILVYNSEAETIRECKLHPNNNWGGAGALGCDIGAGFLHRIPFSKHALQADTPSTTAPPPVETSTTDPPPFRVVPDEEYVQHLAQTNAINASQHTMPPLPPISMVNSDTQDETTIAFSPNILTLQAEQKNQQTLQHALDNPENSQPFVNILPETEVKTPPLPAPPAVVPQHTHAEQRPHPQIHNPQAHMASTTLFSAPQPGVSVSPWLQSNRNSERTPSTIVQNVLHGHTPVPDPTPTTCPPNALYAPAISIADEHAPNKFSNNGYHDENF